MKGKDVLLFLLVLLIAAGVGFFLYRQQGGRGEEIELLFASPSLPASPQPGLININTASQGELESLPGIGPVKAQAIITYRESPNGPFRRVDDLFKVEGIGPKTLETLRPLITVEMALPTPTPTAFIEASPSPSLQPGLVNINTASQQELESLPGIGEVRARDIISYREANGPFRRADDLLKVQGIGPATLEKLRLLITVE